MNSFKSLRGFTLFEMVIAVSIFALIGVVAFGGIGTMTRTGEAVSSANNRLSDIQFAVVYFARDWAQVSPRRIRNQFGDEEPNIQIEDDVITFTRSGWSNLLGEKRSTLQRVQYLVVNEKLIRRHWLSIDQGIGEEPIARILLDDISSLEVVFQNALGQAIREWPLESGQSSDIPVLLAINLDLQEFGEVSR
ncbi:MAG: type II secretion system minor pseudopilin GspJ, partial [Pseudomonadota bacterium]